MFEISKRAHGSVLEVSFNGEIDINAANEIKIFLQSIYTDPSPMILLNLQKVDRVVYSVMPIFLTTVQNLVAGKKVSICGMVPAVERVIKTAPFYNKMKVFPDKKEALRDLLAGPLEKN